MTKIRRATICKAWATLAAACVLPLPAGATPPSGFAVFPLANAPFGEINENTTSNKTDKWGMLLRTLDDSDVGADRVTLQPQGDSGWHSHQSTVFLIVTRGTIEWRDSLLCTPKVLTAGQGVIEHAYRPHTSFNPAAPGGEEAETIAVRIKPSSVIGPQFRIDEPVPLNCAMTASKK